MNACGLGEVVRGVPAVRLVRFAALARAGAGNLEVQAAARRCWAIDPLERAARVLELVQALPYRPDPVELEGDWVRPPCRTLLEGGDCDCLMVLAGALDLCCGLVWRFGWISQPTAALDHVAAQVWGRGRWWWQDATIPGARLGESPDDAVARLGFSERVGL